MEKFRSFTAMLPRHFSLTGGWVVLLLVSAGAWQCKDRHPQTRKGQLIYTNRAEQPITVTLPDSSMVVLHPRTTLEISPSFDVTEREVKLDGEAAFTVSHDGGSPFIVHTRNLHIHVLGTRFRVDAYASNAGEEVDLLAGKLKVIKSYHSSTDNAEEILDAGDMVMINRDIDLMEKEKMNPTELQAAEKKF